VIHFEGDRSYPGPVADVAAKLSDPVFLVGCLPDAKVLVATADRAVWKLKPSVSFLSGSLESALTVAAREPGQSVAYQIVTKAIGASSTVVVRMTFQAAPTGTAVHWVGDLMEVTGLLKMVPKGLVQSTAEKVIGDVWAAVDAKLGRA
jgi:carbon monoxide dehydrogenase subunit G